MLFGELPFWQRPVVDEVERKSETETERQRETERLMSTHSRCMTRKYPRSERILESDTGCGTQVNLLLFIGQFLA